MTALTDTPSKRIDIIPAKRHALILEWLRRNGTASIQDLTADIGASASTIRRDLDHLTAVGYIQRTHGGATLLPELSATFEFESSINAQIAHKQKQAIGAAAAELINPRDSVIFDSSSTVFEAVRALIKRAVPFTAVTNGLEIGLLCAHASDVRAMIIGGTIRPGAPTLVGEPGVEFLKGLHADACMIGTHAIAGDVLTEASPEIAFVKRAMIQASRRRILLADSSKFRANALITFANLTEIDEIVTDDGIAPEQLSNLKAMKLKVTVAPVMDPGEGGGANLRARRREFIRAFTKRHNMERSEFQCRESRLGPPSDTLHVATYRGDAPDREWGRYPLCAETVRSLKHRNDRNLYTRVR